MQTFLPYPDFQASAKILDRQRLGKQRIEAVQILNCLNGKGMGWVNHPAVRMWRGWEESLRGYGMCMCVEWVRRGYVDNTLDQFTNGIIDLTVPDWVTPAFCRSHQSNLIRKQKTFYGWIFPGVPDNLPYIWPRENKVKGVRL